MSNYKSIHSPEILLVSRSSARTKMALQVKVEYGGKRFATLLLENALGVVDSPGKTVILFLVIACCVCETLFICEPLGISTG